MFSYFIRNICVHRRRNPAARKQTIPQIRSDRYAKPNAILNHATAGN